HPGDEQVWAHPLQWMLGRSLLVAPVTQEGASSVTAYLPAGTWVDAFTGEHLDGGRVVERPTPLEEAPVWVRQDDWPELQGVFRP
ncbi:MAG: TIM-barrel domain-containing protein, partial [Pseudolysinimonas sp.]